MAWNFVLLTRLSQLTGSGDHKSFIYRPGTPKVFTTFRLPPAFAEHGESGWR